MSADVLPFVRRGRLPAASTPASPASIPSEPATLAERHNDSIVTAIALLAGPISCPSCEAFLPWIVKGQCQQCLAFVPTDRPRRRDESDSTDK
jgi:hypothetical protein